MLLKMQVLIFSILTADQYCCSGLLISSLVSSAETGFCLNLPLMQGCQMEHVYQADNGVCTTEHVGCGHTSEYAHITGLL